MASEFQVLALRSSQPAPAPSLLPTPTISADMRALKIQHQAIVHKEEKHSPRPLVDRTNVVEDASAPEPQSSEASGWLEKDDFLDDDSSSDTQKTPTKQPILPSKQETPSPIRQVRQILETESPDFDLTPTKDSQLEAGLATLEVEKTPKKQQHMSELSRRVVSALSSPQLGRVLFHSAETTPKRPALLLSADGCGKLREQQSWILRMFPALNIRMIDRDHLMNYCKTGKHFMREKDPLDSWVFHRITHKHSEVWCGIIRDVQGQSGGKFSTFFPRSLTEEDFMELFHHALLDNACLVARQDNRVILQLRDENYCFCVEVYFASERNVIRSVFPLLHFERYHDEKETLEFGYTLKNSLSDQDPTVDHSFDIDYSGLLQQVKDLEPTDPAILYDTPQELFVDIAILTGGNPIKKGVIVAFPKALLK